MRSIVFFLLLALFCSCGAKKEELHIYSWAETFNKELILKFEKEFNCRVVIDTYESNEALFSKLRAGGLGYDIIVPSSYMVEVMVKFNILKKLDRSKIPNSNNLDENHLVKLTQVARDYSTPFTITHTGIGYRKDRIAKPIESWNMFDQSEYRGRMTILNDYRETLGAALMYLGYSVNTIDPEEIDEAAGQVLRWKKNIAKFENDQYKNGLATAEFIIVQAYSSDILQIQEENPKVGFLFPKEGTIVSYDQFAIPKGASNEDLAYKFINFLYEPEHSAENMKVVLSLIPIPDAYPLLESSLRTSITLFPPEDVKSRMQVLEDVGSNIVLYRKAWIKIKEN